MQIFRVFAFFLLLGQAAQAQGTDWSGFYAGGQLEFASVTGEPLGGGATINEGNGLMFGANGGYRFDLGNVVLGANAAAMFGSVNTSPVVAVATPDPTLDLLLRAGIEVGYDLGPVLVHGGIGQTFAIMTNPANRRQTEFGAYFGIGADYMLTDDIMIGADITRTNLDNFAGSDVSVTSFGIGAAYRF